MYFGRRYTGKTLDELIYSDRFRESETKKYKTIEYEEIGAAIFYDSHMDYVILTIINDFRAKKIDKNQCMKLIDKVDAYYYALTEKLMTPPQMVLKLSEEILKNELNRPVHIGVNTDYLY